MTDIEEVCPKRCPLCTQLWYMSVESIGDLVESTPTTLFGIPKFMIRTYTPVDDLDYKHCHGFDPIMKNIVYCHGWNGHIIDLKTDAVWDPVNNIQRDPQTGLYWDIDEEKIVYPATGEEWKCTDEPSIIKGIKNALDL